MYCFLCKIRHTTAVYIVEEQCRLATTLHNYQSFIKVALCSNSTRTREVVYDVSPTSYYMIVRIEACSLIKALQDYSLYEIFFNLDARQLSEGTLRTKVIYQP